MITLTLTNAQAESLFEWCEYERDGVLDMANDQDNDPETRELYEKRYKAIRAVMDQLSGSVR